MNEPLKCGPCAKCRRHAEIMVLSKRTLKYIEESTHISQVGKAGTLPYSKVVNETSRVVRVTLDGENPEPYQGTPHSAGCSETPPAEGMWEESPSDVAKRQLNAPDIEPILTALLTGSKPSSTDMATKSPAAYHYWILWDDLCLNNGVLCWRFEKMHGAGSSIQVIAPRESRKDIVKQICKTFYFQDTLG